MSASDWTTSSQVAVGPRPARNGTTSLLAEAPGAADGSVVATGDRLSIALIGPAYPYRGGIAHHTNMLSLCLRQRGHEVDLITFTRQYPVALYPGSSQEEPDDGGFAGRVIAERMIDAVNPLSWVRVGRELRRRRYDLYIFKFWLPFFGPAFGTIARLVRESGCPNVLVICENVIPHERRLGDMALTRYFFRACDLAVTQCAAVRNDLLRLFPELPQTMLPHPTYENFGPRLPTWQARARLGITAPKVLLFFGFVRAYKGLDRLLAAMPEIVRRLPDVHLLVVGEFLDDPGSYLRLIRDGGIEDHVTVYDRYVPNDGVRLWFSAADMVVLPYRSASNSGIVQIAYNFATPMIVTDVGSLAEVVADGQTGFVLDDASPASIAEAVQKIYQGDTLERFAAAVAAGRRKYSWESFARGLEELVRRHRIGEQNGKGGA
jgi:D-inositol-3-phosphate glycosyltransferase